MLFKKKKLEPKRNVFEGIIKRAEGSGKKIVLPEKLRQIKPCAFQNDYYLKIIEGIENVTGVDKYTLSDTAFYRESDVVICGTDLLKCSRNDKIYVVPDGITRIGQNAFSCYIENDELEEIILPESVKEIGECAFSKRKCSF